MMSASDMRYILTLSAFSLLCFNLLYVSCLADSPKHIALVASQVNLSMLHRIESALFSEPTPRPNIVRIDPERPESMAEIQLNHYDLIVTLGIKSTEQVLELTEMDPVLALLVQKNAFLRLQRKHTHRVVTAIFLDHPIGRQLNLIKEILLPSEQHLPLGVLLGPTSAFDREFLQHEAHERNLKLKIAYVSEDENPIQGLGFVLTDTALVLALPDQQVFNPDTAKGILLAAFRKKVPLIGYTRTYVSKGAIAAVYSTPEQISKEAASYILELVEKPSKEYPAPRFPRAFTVTVNQHAARSLGRSINSDAAIQYAMQEKEKISPEGEYCSLPWQKNIIGQSS